MAGKTFHCPNCGSAVEVHFGESRAAVCGNCRSMLRLGMGTPEVLGRILRAGPTPVLRAGMRGRFRDRPVAVIGMTRYRVESWFWDNYLLLDDRDHVQWLSYDSFRFKLSQTPADPPANWQAAVKGAMSRAARDFLFLGGRRVDINERGQAA